MANVCVHVQREASDSILSRQEAEGERVNHEQYQQPDELYSPPLFPEGLEESSCFPTLT